MRLLAAVALGALAAYGAALYVVARALEFEWGAE